MSKKLQFQGEKSPSIGPKVAITSWYLLCAAGAAWPTFSAPMELNRPGSASRQVALLACVVIYVARAAHTLFAFVKRKVPWWEAAWGGGLAARYGTEFDRYARRTSTLVPLLY